MKVAHEHWIVIERALNKHSGAIHVSRGAIVEIADYIVTQQNEALLVGQSSAPGATFDVHARDAFARAALTGLLANPALASGTWDPTELADAAFQYAELCLLRRVKAREA